MDKRLKNSFTKLPLSLYNCEWVEKAATEGFHRCLKNMEVLMPGISSQADIGSTGVAILYYSAFEDALNTFLFQVMEDTTHEIEIFLHELGKINVECKTKESKNKKKKN